MPSDLAQHIGQLKVMDTHEHMCKEPDWVGDQRDVLALLINNYHERDLRTGGASNEAIQRALDPSDPDVEGRFAGIEKAWAAGRFTGYSEAVSLVAKEVFGIDRINPQTLRAAQPQIDALRQPGRRLHILRDLAGLDHIQTDDFCWQCMPDESGSDFFLYDLGWRDFCNGLVHVDQLARETGVTVGDLASLGQAMAGLFDKYGPCAIAVKSQHAYDRTLRWIERSDDDAERALQEQVELYLDTV